MQDKIRLLPKEIDALSIKSQRQIDHVNSEFDAQKCGKK